MIQTKFGDSEDAKYLLNKGISDFRHSRCFFIQIVLESLRHMARASHSKQKRAEHVMASRFNSSTG